MIPDFSIDSAELWTSVYTNSDFVLSSDISVLKVFSWTTKYVKLNSSCQNVRALSLCAYDSKSRSILSKVNVFVSCAVSSIDDTTAFKTANFYSILN